MMPEQRREDILEATLALIEERGIGQIRGADLAERIGVSTGLIFYHFGNLDSVITEAISFAARRDLEHLDVVSAGAAEDGAEAQLRAVLHEYGPTGQAFGWRLWVESWSASLRESALRKVIAELDEGWRSVITSIIDAGVTTGECECPAPGAAAWRLPGMVDGLAVQWVVFDSAVGPDLIDEWIAVAIGNELRTVSRRS